MTRIGVLILLIFAGALIAPAQQSDRIIVDQFESQSKELLRGVDSAKTVQDCAEIGTSIDLLEKEFTVHQALLDRALFPENFLATLATMRGRLVVRQRDLGVIEAQFVRISELELRVRDLSDQVTKLSSDNKSLAAEIARLSSTEQARRDQRSIDSLRSLVKKLQQNLIDRDQLIFALVDSIFLQYGKDVASLKDVDKQGVVSKMERRDVFTSIKRAIAENLQFLEATGLKGNDFAELAREQKAFSTKWNGLGPRLAQVYASGKQRANEIALIDTMLGRWSAKMDQRLWQTLASTFKERGYSLKEFSNGEQFFNSLMMFLQDEIRNARNEPPDTRSKLFANFDGSLWRSDLEPVWLPVLVETGNLTPGQKEQIEDKVAEWRRSVSGYSWMTIAVIALIVLVVGYAVSRLLFRKPKAPVA
jgi:hypothetical protein